MWNPYQNTNCIVCDDTEFERRDFKFQDASLSDACARFSRWSADDVVINLVPWLAKFDAQQMNLLTDDTTCKTDNTTSVLLSPSFNKTYDYISHVQAAEQCISINLLIYVTISTFQRGRIRCNWLFTYSKGNGKMSIIYVIIHFAVCWVNF